MIDSEYQDIRVGCFQVLFRSLCEDWDEIAQEANKALNFILARSRTSPHLKFSKDVLWDNLKPILGLVNDFNRLSVSLLQGLQVVRKFPLVRNDE